MMRRLVFLTLLCLSQAVRGADAPRIRAVFDRDSIMIGDRVTLTVEVDKDIMQVVGFPAFDGNMVGGVLEVLEDGPADTLSRDGRTERISKRYVLTSFEEGNFRLGGFPVLYAGKNVVDTLYSPDSLTLFVGTFAIDTASRTIYDIKPTVGAPLLVGEVRGYVIWGVLLLSALVSVVWFAVRRLRKGSAAGSSETVFEPPHLRAIRELETLQGQKLWQSGRHKQYYTRLSDIVRRYIEGRWNAAAPEMTTEETVAAASGFGLSEERLAGLARLLRTADLVKFAKHVPAAGENEAFWYDAYYFVEETKEEAAVEADEGKEAGDE